jgi:hypothetical protein
MSHRRLDLIRRSDGVVLVKNDLRDVVSLVGLRRKSYRKTQENLVWEAGYNVFVIPPAAGLFLWTSTVNCPSPRRRRTSQQRKTRDSVRLTRRFEFFYSVYIQN